MIVFICKWLKKTFLLTHGFCFPSTIEGVGPPTCHVLPWSAEISTRLTWLASLGSDEEQFNFTLNGERR
jgi:hypothetical protein